METIFYQKFVNETISFDGFHFIGCTFVNCIIIVETSNFHFDRCSFIESAFHVAQGLTVFQSMPFEDDSDPAGFWSAVYSNTPLNA
ncbi:hypothetical protein EBB07_17635 [Paenibacillaceae bacterium]|nr:hypothetical protein EBB07_17635 [Paenibacillaceae bacterium]